MTFDSAIELYASVVTHDSILSIAGSDWDSLLTPGDTLATHRFVSACENSRIEGARFWHLLASKNDSPVGLASFFHMDVKLDLLADGYIGYVLGQMRNVWPGLMSMPTLFCGLPVSFGSSCLRFNNDPDWKNTAARIVESMEKIAIKIGTDLLCVKELNEEQHQMLSPVLRDAGFFPACSLPGCSLDLPWKNMAEYEGSLRAGYRRQLRQDRLALKSAGMTITFGSGIMPDADTAHRLYSQVIERASIKLEILPFEFFQMMETLLRNQIQGIVVWHKDKPVANAILLWDEPVCYFLLVGLDYANLAAGHVYQNLVAGVIEAAITLGAGRLELGQMSYALKTRLGAHTTPRYIWIKHRSSSIHFLLNRAAPWLFPRAIIQDRQVFKFQGSAPVVDVYHAAKFH